jgi:SAM-dependent methyltransferase
MRALRRKFIAEHADLQRARLLEIGAMDSPTFPELDGRYLDWFSQEELRAAIANNPNRIPKRVVSPDYVVKTKHFAAEVSDSFDIVIANHVVEHIADPVSWLQEIAKLVPAGGGLFLAVPDRRYTFDYLRPVSTAVDLLRAHEEDLERPSRWQVLESIFYHRPVRAPDFWDGGYQEKLRKSRFSLDEAVARSARADDEYLDVHCHVFSFETFSALIDDLSVGGFIDWTLADLRDVPDGSNEFHAYMQRTFAS